MMGRKEAADLLDNLIGMVEDNHGADYDTALKMGIEALSSANGDMISRQAAIDAIKTWGLIDGLSEGQAIEILEDEEKLPSAQPEIIRCGECTHKDKKIDYCHYLGITICERDYCSFAERRTDG